MSEITSTDTDIEAVRDLLKQSSNFQAFVGAQGSEANAKDRIYPFRLVSDEEEGIPPAYAIVRHGENYVERTSDFGGGKMREPEMIVVFGRLRKSGDEGVSDRNAIVGVDNDIEAIKDDLFTTKGGTDFDFADIRRLEREVVEEYTRDDWDGVVSGIILEPIIEG